MAHIDYASIFNDGFKIWRKNPFLFIPYLLNITTIITLGLLITGTSLLYLKPELLTQLLIYPFLFPSNDIVIEIFRLLQSHMLEIILIAIISTIALNIINAFYYAGAIGMYYTAIKKGVSTTNQMLYYGRTNLKQIFICNLCITFAIILGLFIFLPVTIDLIPNILQNGFEPTIVTKSTNILLLFELFIVYVLLITTLTMLAPYGIVIEKLTALSAIKRSISLIWHNKINTILILIIISVLVSLFYPLIFIPQIGWLIFLIILYLILIPLSGVWLTKYYLILIKK
ncbi:MAG: hypothetical protein KKC68_01760 [Candidatus Thermoplasmatota archaeon]|nr:hypothetical protein [Candidatus Thermoplasmatota archaeon]MBU1940474.1 hypothetical protein [Candidatus Thermoplasmatota archaeon]